jgi:DNA adenine methylase
MKYMGSKNRIAKHILPIMLKEAEKHNITQWVEPFVGGANMIDKVPNTFTRIGADLNPHTIEALIAIRDLVDELPDSVSEAEYKAMKGLPPEPISSWVRIACSYGGIFESKLAADKTSDRNYVQEAIRNAKKQSPLLKGVGLVNCSYDEIVLTKPSLIYCDPPYQGTSGYKTGSFNHEVFFHWCVQKKQEGHVVFVSEYNAPFECVWQGEIKTNFASSRKEATHVAVEKLFLV